MGHYRKRAVLSGGMVPVSQLDQLVLAVQDLIEMGLEQLEFVAWLGFRLHQGLRAWTQIARFSHQSLNYQTPTQVHLSNDKKLF